MGQGEPPEYSAFSADDEELLGDCHCAHDVLAFLGVVELVYVVDLVDVRLVVNEPADLPAHLPVADLRGRLEHGQSRRLALVLPHVDVVLRAGDDVRL